MLFADVSDEACSDRGMERAGLIEAMLGAFRTAFPTIAYELVPRARLVNAQALMLGSARTVKLYGGLAFHPKLEGDGLAFALLHETGHHLATGPRLPWDPFLACECHADRWAIGEGASILAASGGYAVDMALAGAQLDALAGSIADNPTAVDDARSDRACWSQSWPVRMAVLSGDTRRPPRECPLEVDVLNSIAPAHGQ